MNQSRAPLWITIAALFVSCMTFLVNTYFQYESRQDIIRNDARQRRQQALLAGLKVIDHVYSNVSFNDSLPSNPHEWNIQEARDAMNAMTIYCQYPDQTLDTFKLTLGLHNPQFQKSPRVRLEYLSAFRRQVAHELGLETLGYTDSLTIWIYQLPGGH